MPGQRKTLSIAMIAMNEEANLNVLDEKVVAAHQVFEEDKSHSREKIRGASDRFSPGKCSSEVVPKRR